MDNYQGMPQIPWGSHSPISSLYHQQQSMQDYKSENNSLYGSPYTPIIHSPDISPVNSPDPEGEQKLKIVTIINQILIYCLSYIINLKHYQPYLSLIF